MLVLVLALEPGSVLILVLALELGLALVLEPALVLVLFSKNIWRKQKRGGKEIQEKVRQEIGNKSKLELQSVGDNRYLE